MLGAMASNIKVHLRLRPTSKTSPALSLPPHDDNRVEFNLDKPDETANNSKTKYGFKFDSVIGMDATQEEVFNRIAVPVIDDAVKGVNGTIFAYGQTGSGKTFTITGGTDRYVDRGLIPRTICHLFELMKKEQKSSFRMYISYFEIYNESGYDLLSREDSATKLDDLPKVQMREDEDGNIHLKNLTVNMAGTEEDALNLLFLGDTNRVVAETPMNDASTRSHCIFIIWIESTAIGSDTVRRSKIHLVDLSGSERIVKTGIEGTLLKEAKYINLSLHYLEQVIVALHERSQGVRSHVPYRNSMMTSVLRDSLGGNCKTVMIATVAVETINVDESISTCRFAQRVALIQNSAIVNEELDPNLIIRRLKKEIVELKEQLKLANGGDEEEEITPEVQDACLKLVKEWLADKDGPIICGNYSRFQACFNILRNMLENSTPKEKDDKGGEKASSNSEEVAKLRAGLAQRDNEINILVQMINKKQASGGEQQNYAPQSRNPAVAENHALTSTSASASFAPKSGVTSPKHGGAAGSTSSRAAPNLVQKQLLEQQKKKLAAPVPVGDEAVALLLDRNRAFEVFRKSVRRSEVYGENIELMKKIYGEAKELGEEGNAARNSINTLKTKVEQLRLERAMTAPQNDEDFNAQKDPEEEELLQEMERHKAVYEKSTNLLRKKKGDIDRIKNLLEQNKTRLQRDFEQWFHTLRLEASQGLQTSKTELSTGRSVNGEQKEKASISIRNATMDCPKTGDQSVDQDIAEYYATINTIRSSSQNR